MELLNKANVASRPLQTFNIFQRCVDALTAIFISKCPHLVSSMHKILALTPHASLLQTELPRAPGSEHCSVPQAGGGRSVGGCRIILGLISPFGGPGSPLESGEESPDPADPTLLQQTSTLPNDIWKGQKKPENQTFHKCKEFLKPDYHIHVRRHYVFGLVFRLVFLSSSLPPLCPHTFLGINLIKAPALRESVSQSTNKHHSSIMGLAWVPGLGTEQGTGQKKIPALRNLSLGEEGEKADINSR